MTLTIFHNTLFNLRGSMSSPNKTVWPKLHFTASALLELESTSCKSEPKSEGFPLGCSHVPDDTDLLIYSPLRARTPDLPTARSREKLIDLYLVLQATHDALASKPVVFHVLLQSVAHPTLQLA